MYHQSAERQVMVKVQPDSRRPFHGQKRSLQDIDTINGRGGDDTDTHEGTDVSQCSGQQAAPGMRQFFGIKKKRRGASGRQNNTGSDHRSSQWSSAYFIQPCNTRVTSGVQGAFKKKGVVGIGSDGGKKIFNPLQRIVRP
jgi:hypothetical protein